MIILQHIITVLKNFDRINDSVRVAPVIHFFHNYSLFSLKEEKFTIN